MTYLVVVVVDWLRIEGKKRERGNLSNLGLPNDIIVNIRK